MGHFDPLLPVRAGIFFERQTVPTGKAGWRGALLRLQAAVWMLPVTKPNHRRLIMAKRILIGFALVAIITSSAFAQESQEKKKSIFGLAPGISESHFFINGGVGLQTFSWSEVGVSGLAIKASGDYVFETTLKSGAKVPVSFGVGLNYSIISKDYGYGLVIDYGAFIIDVRSLYHFNFLKNLDTYAGLILGYAFGSNNWSNFRIGAGAGTRYFFTKNIGIYAELDYLLFTYWPFDVTAGIAVKF
jgi:opacity protein-like surface antigen